MWFRSTRREGDDSRDNLEEMLTFGMELVELLGDKTSMKM